MLISKLRAFYKSKFTFVLIAVFLGLVILAWFHRFIQDDAFISFRYAYNLVHGKGLEWNEGYRVEGYSNLLWTLLMAIPIYYRANPVTFSFALGLVLFALSLVLTYKLASLLLGSRDHAVLTIILLGTNYTFSSYATGGLETQLQTSLLVSSAYLLVRSITTSAWNNARLLALSALLSLTILTRLDSLLPAVVILSFVIVCLFRARFAITTKLEKLALVLGPVVLLSGIWTIWRVRYYGDILPNTYYVKLATSTSYQRGLEYLYSFLDSYWLVLFPILLLLACRQLFARSNTLLLIPSIIVTFWLLYTVKASGDFMEFRFLVPVLPFFFLLIGWLVFVVTRQRALQAALFLLVLLGSLHHALTFNGVYEIESIHWLSAHLRPEGSNWEGIGKFLGESFNYDPGITIATTAAGAIPYYSRLRTIDMYGINDLWIARHGRIVTSRPGHQRFATFGYLVAQRVNLVIGHPFIVNNDFSYQYFKSPLEPFEFFNIPAAELKDVPSNSKLVEIPVESGRKLFAIYLIENSHVDEVIRERGWRAYPLRSLTGRAIPAP